jgi:metal-responsive CopG/Arc/MetJ family transcriptional regulator
MHPLKRKLMPRAKLVTRASITFPPKLYRTLEAIAKQKKVSVAWVVRDAAEKYVSEQSPHQRAAMK